MANEKIFFITGTDTDAGKTLVSCSILSAAIAKGLTTAALKPVAAGVSKCAEGFHNDDVLALAEYCTEELTLQDINPCCFSDPIAPNIAAANSGIVLEAESIARQCSKVLSLDAALTLVEGAGGWKVPLSDKESMSDIAKALGVPVILVVGMRLGCLNHAVLTAQSIQADGLRFAGWIANHIDSQMAVSQENLATLIRIMPGPLLAEIPYIKGEDRIGQAAQSINVEKIISA